MSDQEIVSVVTAHMEGKTIEFLDPSEGWMEATMPTWNFGARNYRVKPEPRRFWLNIYEPPLMVGGYHSSKEAADNAAQCGGTGRLECVEVVEVLHECRGNV